MAYGLVEHGEDGVIFRESPDGYVTHRTCVIGRDMQHDVVDCGNVLQLMINSMQHDQPSETVLDLLNKMVRVCVLCLAVMYRAM